MFLAIWAVQKARHTHSVFCAKRMTPLSPLRLWQGMAAVLAAKELVRRGVLKLEQLRGDGGVALQLRCFPVRGLVLRVSVPGDSNR